ncbi:hypothetical protein GCM10025858_10450 [Alicyclobacillus sacchari]|nr:hypothetical protein GCM10025858_10450 [Alicyclobacillus sacchari]
MMGGIDLDVPRQHGRHLHNGEQGRIVLATAFYRLKQNGHIQCSVGEHGKRVARVDGKRRQHGKDVFVIIVFQIRLLLYGQLLAREKVNAFAAQRRQQGAGPHAVEPIDIGVHAL